MHLADDGVARDAAELRSDLARRQAVGPKLLSHFDAFVGPAHALYPQQSLRRKSLDGIKRLVWAATGWPDTHCRYNLR